MNIVIIKGMKMPENCKYCDLREHIVCGYTRAPVDKWKYTNKYNGRRHEACPLVEIEFNEEQFNTVQKMLLER